MLDKTRGFPPFRSARPSVFLMSPEEHFLQAFKLRQLKNNPRAQQLAKHHDFLARHIRKELDAGRAHLREDLDNKKLSD